MKNVGVIFEKICIVILSLLGGTIFFALSHWAAKYRHVYPADYEVEKVYRYFDDCITNWLCLGMTILLFLVIRLLVDRLEETYRKKVIRGIVLAGDAAIGIFLMVWVTISHVKPVDDQMQVIYAAQEFLEGNYVQMTTYFATYPHQYGMTFLFEPLFRIWNDYRAIQYLNVIFVMLIVYFLFRIVDETFANDYISLFSFVGIVLYTPLYLYVNFAYGELWSMAFGTIAVWAVIRFFKSEQIGYIVIAVLGMSIATIARKSVLIWAVAVAILLMVGAIKRLHSRMVLYAALIVAVPLLSLRLVAVSYEMRSGIEIKPGVPNELYIAMGLQDDWKGAGVYNAYNNSTFNGEAGCDAEVAEQIGRAYIVGRVGEFVDNPAMARQFFMNKICEQWNEVTFGSLFMTAYFEEEPESIVENVYYGEARNRIVRWQERYVFILYVCVTMFALLSIVKKRDIHQMACLLIIVGGFLFSLVWEAKSRYVFPHTIYMLPIFACAMYEIQSSILWIYEKGHMLCGKARNKQ